MISIAKNIIYWPLVSVPLRLMVNHVNFGVIIPSPSNGPRRPDDARGLLVKLRTEENGSADRAILRRQDGPTLYIGFGFSWAKPENAAKARWGDDNGGGIELRCKTSILSNQTCSVIVVLRKDGKTYGMRYPRKESTGASSQITQVGRDKDVTPGKSAVTPKGQTLDPSSIFWMLCKYKALHGATSVGLRYDDGVVEYLTSRQPPVKDNFFSGSEVKRMEDVFCAPDGGEVFRLQDTEVVS
ncbi:hypothetical protein IW262DRAFT_1302144 [Armillaria fumosa]|nr:hypothetical protein IW262DRAFT_1302144 [Armillaria fumosa]